MIKWRLNVLMAEKRLKNNQLAAITGMHPLTISNLKNSTEVPERLERTMLEKLCQALNCQPGDLMVWEPNTEFVNAVEFLDNLPALQTDSEKVVADMRNDWD